MRHPLHGLSVYWTLVRPDVVATKGLCIVQILEFVLQVILGITSLLLTLLILLHKGRGGGLSDMFGGGMTSALGSSGLAERNLNRFTIILALVWFVAIVALGLITKFQGI
ncbi:hypothetical protein GCM10009808_09270 [Microbacterium sediminicola]|uniref:Protein-export membrane protein SecG n=1 Tax=Microbacterium sediminicola TaxID=415210 RepID=A0ABN2HVP9_9MICO